MSHVKFHIFLEARMHIPEGWTFLEASYMMDLNFLLFLIFVESIVY